VRRSEYAEVVDWLYFTVTDSDASTRLVVRRNGPRIQLLTPNGWINEPRLFARFLDHGFLEEVTFEEALAAAQTLDLPLAARLDEDTTDAYLDLPSPRYQGVLRNKTAQPSTSCSRERSAARSSCRSCRPPLAARRDWRNEGSDGRAERALGRL